MYKVIDIFSSIQQVNDTDFCSLFFKLFADTFSDTSRATRDYGDFVFKYAIHIIFTPCFCIQCLWHYKTVYIC